MATDDLEAASEEFFKKRGRPTQSGASQIPGLTLEDEAAAFFEQRKKRQAEGMRAETAKRPPAVPLSDFKGQTLQFGPWDTGVELNPGVARSLAQSGSGFADMILGAKQLAGKAGTAEADEKRKFDDPLNRGVTGTLNSMVPKVMAASLLPQSLFSSPVATGIGTGALQGAMEPVATGESRMANTAIGGAAGAFVPQAVKTANNVAQTADPVMGPLAQEAGRRGFKMGLVDTAEPGFATSFRNVGRYVPLFKDQIERWDVARQKLFNKQIGESIGLADQPLTTASVKAQHDKLNQAIEDTWSNKQFVVTKTMRQQLADIRARANENSPAVAAPVNQRIDELESRIQTITKIDPVSGLPYSQDVIPGKVAHNYQEGWARSYDTEGKKIVPHQKDPLMEDVRNVVTGEFDKQLPQGEREALATMNAQREGARAILPATVKGETGQAQRELGNMTPQDLSQSITNYFGQNAKDTVFGELPKIGQQILRDTSTRNRSLLANSAPLIGGAGAGALVGDTMGAISNPGVFSIGASLGSAIATAGGIGAGMGSLAASPGFRKLMTEAPTSFTNEMARRMGKQAMVQGPLAAHESYDTSRQLGTEKESEPPRVEVNGTRDNMTPEDREDIRRLLEGSTN